MTTNKNLPSMSARERLRLAFDILRHDPKRMRTALARKDAPYAWSPSQADRPLWQTTDYNSYVSEGFNLNTLVYSAIAYKVRSGILAPLRAFEGELGHPKAIDPGHPLAQLMKRPNKYLSGVQLQMLNDTYLNIAGQCYVFLERKGTTQLPQAMYPLRPDRTYIIPSPADSKELLGYLYSPSGSPYDPKAFPILPQDMVHIKLPRADDPLEGLGYGLSPLQPSGRSIDVDNAATNFLKLFFQKGTMIHTYLKYDVSMDDDMVKAARQRFMEIYGGYDKWLGPAVVDQAGEIKNFSLSFKDMGFDALDERNESRIVGPLGVPLILIGARLGLMRSTYENFKEARLQFWEDTRLPELKLFEESYQYFLQSDDGVFVKYDLSDVPALRRDMSAFVAAFTILVASGVPKHTAAETVGLDIGTLPDGDVVYNPLNWVAAGMDTTGSDTGTEQAVDATRDTRKQRESPSGMFARMIKAIQRNA